MDYKPIIESAYNRKNWQELLHDIFGRRITFFATPTRIDDVNNNTAKHALYLGKIDLADGKTIAVYEVPLAESVVIERNKVNIRNLLVSHWRNSGFAGAFMFCFKENEAVLRFSYVSEIMAFKEDGKLETEATDTKRYTYILGEGRGCRTAIEQFSKLKESAQNLSDVTEAFSVETLTKQFYKDLFEWYQWAVDGSSNISFPNNTTTEADDREDIEKKVIRMITRIMFVWFIKQKDLVPHKIFDPKFLKTVLKDFDPNSRTNGNFYNAILQNLFFATLNRAIVDEDGNKRKFATSTKRDIKTLYRYADMFKISEEQVVDLFADVPFLNGGLFECLDKTRYIDGVEVAYNYDGFSRNDHTFADGRFKHRAVVPNNLFFEQEKGLLSILNRYNFTIEENTPEEQQVALDPELLGKVFENLLGAYNPETKETARNQSGSFYTPREIVNYMVDESLIAFLGDTPFVRSLFSSDFTYDDKQKTEYKKVADKLKSVKVLDPACGSGAFPMGLLNRMMDILERISPEESVYDLKLAIIENCLYGSDIQSIAAQITKLRFFISLICNCDKDASKPNFGIPTLPNLETKFVTANSLIAKKKRAAQTNLFENPEIEPTKEELARIRHEHFSAKSASTKRRLREKDQVLREKLAQLLSDDNNFAPEDAKQMAEWNPYDQNTVSPFFDPEWMFGVKDGFDIVIGNPPYISTKGVSNEDKKAYENEFGFSDDTYNLFTFKGLSLTKLGGSLTYIIPKTFWTTQTKRNMRDLLLSKNIRYIYDTANPFESVMVDTCIIQVINTPYKKDNTIRFRDGSKNLLVPTEFQPVRQSMYINTQNAVIFKPTELNLKIWNLYGEKVKALYDKWWDKIKTSRDIEKNKVALESYRASLKPGDVALLGCLTEGGQGLATANNGKYIAIRKSSKWAENVYNSRPKKLTEAIAKYPKISSYIHNLSPQDFLASASEYQIAQTFDRIKEDFGRDVFGQGYIFRLIDDSEIANVDSLTDDEKENGISTDKPYYVPYDKGDKDGNRWYLETPFAIAWSKENVQFLKTDPKARYQGYTFFFKEGFCWNNVLNPLARLLKVKMKAPSVNDVGSMSLCTLVSFVPNCYIVSLLNSDLLFDYYREFLNCTVNIQINDIRQMPIVIPSKSEVDVVYELFHRAYSIKQSNSEMFSNELQEIEKRIDLKVKELYRI